MLTRPHSRHDLSAALRRVVAVVCVLLVLLLGAAQLLHSHGPDQASDPGCSLCAVAHMSALHVPVIAGPVRTQALVAARRAEQSSVPECLPIHHFYIRPPPVLNVSA